MNTSFIVVQWVPQLSSMIHIACINNETHTWIEIDCACFFQSSEGNAVNCDVEGREIKWKSVERELRNLSRVLLWEK